MANVRVEKEEGEEEAVKAYHFGVIDRRCHTSGLLLAEQFPPSIGIENFPKLQCSSEYQHPWHN